MANRVDSGENDEVVGTNGREEVNLDDQNVFGGVAGTFLPEVQDRVGGMNPNFADFGPYAFTTGVNPNLGNSFGFGGNPNSNFGNTHFGNGGPSMVMDPYSMSRNEVDTGKSIVKRVLTGRENYISWRLAMEIALSGRSQLGFVRGEYPRPDDPLMAARWQKCNDIIMSWLISSVSESISEQIMRSKNVVVAWNMLKMRYGGTNLARKSVLMAQLSNCSQGDSDVSTYFDRLGKFWQELDAIEELKSCANMGTCVCCKESEKKIQEDRVVKFLLGLNDSFAVVRSNIFAMSNVPPIDKVYDLVTQEESQQNVKKGVFTESSAMYSSSGNRGRYNNGGRGSFGRGRPRVQCSHCQMPGRTKESCYKLIGYPSGWKSRDVNRPELGMFNANKAETVANSSVTVPSSGSQFTSEHITQLSKMLEMMKGGAVNYSQTQMAGPGAQDSPKDWGT